MTWTHIPFRFDIETVRQMFDILVEFGLNVDSLTPSWLNDRFIQEMSAGSRDIFIWDYDDRFREAMLVTDLYVFLRTPHHLRPRVLDAIYSLNRDIFQYLHHYSNQGTTHLTRSGVYLAAERGRAHLSRYLDSFSAQTPEYRGLLEMIFIEQFIWTFNLVVAHTLLEHGVGFGGFPEDLDLSLPLQRFVAAIKQDSIKPETLSILRRLLRHGATIDADVIAVAVEEQGTSILRLLSEFEADFAIYGTPAIFMAALFNNYEAINWLLEAGVDINASILLRGKLTTVVGGFFKKITNYSHILQRSFSVHTLYFGVWNRKGDLGNSFSVSMFKYLVGRGASLCPQPGSSQPNSLLIHAVKTGKHRSDIVDIVSYLLETQGGFRDPLPSQPCLFEECFQDHPSCSHASDKTLDCGLPLFKFLLKRGVPIIRGGVLGHLIYHKAPLDLIHSVIDSGVDLNAYSGHDRGPEDVLDAAFPFHITALQAAASVDDLVLVRRLVDKGAVINLPGKGQIGRTALQAACLPIPLFSQDDTTVALVKFLIDNGAEVNAPAAPCGYTALQAAASAGNLRIATILLDHGADVNAPPGEISNRSALDCAVARGRLDMAKFLLDLGALSAKRGESGYDGAIECAEEYRHWAVVALLREHAKQYTDIRNLLRESGC